LSYADRLWLVLAKLSYDRSVCLSVCLSVRPSLCHTLGFYENNANYDHELFTVRVYFGTSRIREAFPETHPEREWVKKIGDLLFIVVSQKR